jgi:hypothetical protein
MKLLLICSEILFHLSEGFEIKDSLKAIRASSDIRNQTYNSFPAS